MKLSLFSEYKGLRKELYVLFIGQIMTNMGAMIWPMFTLILNQKLGLSAGTIAVCMTVYSLAAIPIGLIGGKLADKFNKKKIILVCDTISILSYLYCWIVPLSIPSILIFAIASLFQSAESPSYAALVADFTGSADRERAYSLSYLGSNLGLMLAPTLGGLLFNRYLSIAFLINGLAIASSTLLIGFFIRNVEKEPDDHPESVYEKEIDHQISAFSYLLKNRVLLLMLLVTALYATVYAMFNYLMPLDLVSANGDKGSVLFGTMTSVNCVVVVLLTAPITRLFRRISDIGKTGIGQALIGFGYLIFVLFYLFLLPAIWLFSFLQ
jgi:MFS family permease